MNNMNEVTFIQKKSSLQECCFISIPKEGKRAIWELTHYCPHNCKYCFTSSTHKKNIEREFLNLNYCKIIDNFKKLNVKDVLLTGGEPLSLEEGIIEIIQLLDKKKISYSISTTCNPKKYFEKICSYNSRRINLSFDPKQNDGNISMKSDINNLIENINFLYKKNIPVKLNSVITKYNVNYLNDFSDNIIYLFSKFKNIEKIALANEYPIGRGMQQEGIPLEKLEEIYNNLKSKLSTINKKYIFVNWPSFNDELQNCPAANAIFSIMPNGDIAPCSLLYYMSRSFKSGNIITNSIDEIKVLLSDFHKGVKQHIEELKSRNQKCKICNNNKSCGGGCFAMMPVLMADHKERIICKYQPDIISDEQKQFFTEVQKPFNGEYSIPTSSGKNDDLDKKLEKKIIKYVKKRVSKADLAHNFEHIENVVKIGRTIAKSEKANMKIVLISCYFHDVSQRDASMHHFHTINAAKIAEEFLIQNSDLSKEELIHIKECIISSSHGSYLIGIEPQSIEAKIVRDADLLDAIGARGIARVFAFAEAHDLTKFGEVKYDPEHPPYIFDMNLTGPDRSPIHHFYTKLLKLKTLIYTKRGKEIAEDKHKFMVEFLRKYSNESNLEKSNGLQSSIDTWNSGYA